MKPITLYPRKFTYHRHVTFPLEETTIAHAVFAVNTAPDRLMLQFVNYAEDGNSYITLIVPGATDVDGGAALSK